MATHPLAQLAVLGQSPWHDNIRRSLLTSGALRKMVQAGDITGLTSNPTIFEQAIAGSPDYDDQIAKLARAGKAAIDIYDAMSIDDIRAAALPALRHRVILNFEGEAEGVDPDKIIGAILDSTPEALPQAATR